MKHNSLAVSLLLFAFLVPLMGTDFVAFGSGNWGDPETWGGSGATDLPGPDDNVYIPGGIVVTGGGACHNLSIGSSGGIPGQLIGQFAYLSECLVTGDLLCDGYLLPGAGGGLYNLSVWGNVAVNNTLLVTSFNLTGSSTSVPDQVAFSQAPGAWFHAPITVSTTFPGIKLLTDIDLDLNDPMHTRGSITGAEIYLYGHTIATTNLINCFFPSSTDCNSGGILNCGLSNVESWVELNNYGISELLNNQCVFNGPFVNHATFSGPVSMAGTLQCDDLLNNGLFQPGWNGSLNLFCTGDIINNHTLITDVVFTAGLQHTWSEGAGSVTDGNYVNMSPQLTLLTDMTLTPGNNFSAGNLFLNGQTLQQANLYNGTIQAQGGALTDCTLATLDIYGDVYLAGYCRLLDNGTVFNGTTAVNGILEGAQVIDCSTVVHGMLYNYGTLTRGWQGCFSLTLGDGYSNHGTTTVDLITFSGDAPQYLNWSDGSVFDFDLQNQTPNLVLMGQAAVNANFCDWYLGNCTVSFSPEISFVNLFDCVIGGDYTLTLGFATATSVQFDLDLAVGGMGLTVIGTNHFNQALEVNGALAGNNGGNDHIFCAGDVTLNAGGLFNGYDGTLTAHLAQDLIINSADASFYNLVFSGAPLHLLHKNDPGSGFQTLVNLFPGETLRLMTDLNADFGTLFDLNTALLDLNAHQLSLARIINGRVQNGTVYAGRISSLELTDITLDYEVVIEDSACEAHGTIVNQGALISEDSEDTVFPVHGCITNNLLVSGGYYGSLTLACHGSVNNQGEWDASTLILGDQPRNLHLYAPSYPITVSAGSQPSLTGANLLSPFAVESGATLTLESGASLQMGAIDEYYLANQPGYGSFLNHGSFQNERYLSGSDMMQYNGLEVWPSDQLAADYYRLGAEHAYGQVPPELPDALGEVWNLTPGDYTQIRNGQLVFTHSADLLTRDLQSSLQLFHRLPGAGSWLPYAGASACDPADNTFTALDIPVGGSYAFVVSALETPADFSIQAEPSMGGTVPKLTWNPVPGASYYEVAAADNPSGPWSPAAYPTDCFWTDAAAPALRFYRVIAHRGVMP
jgi:hypothetical protein